MNKACCDTDTGQNNKNHFNIGLLGNPNCGKSTLFNQLTGSRQRIGNWPGVTVDRKVGQFEFSGTGFDLVDLPGVYSLDNSARSLDERITRDYILSAEPDVIINVVDASNLERNLYLTSQLLEMQVPMVLAVNMMDVAEAHQLKIHPIQLASALGCRVVPLIAHIGQGLNELKQAVLETAREQQAPAAVLRYSQDIEAAINQLLDTLSQLPLPLAGEGGGEGTLQDKTPSPQPSPSKGEGASHPCGHLNCRWLAAQVLDGDSGIGSIKHIPPAMLEHAKQLRQHIEQSQGEDLDILLADGRYGFARALATAAVSRPEQHRHSRSDRIDQIVLNRWLGLPIFLGIIYLMFLFTINLGGAFIDFFDLAAAAIFVDGFGELLTSLGAPDWLRVLLANGLGGGVQVVATFIPIIGFLYLFLSFLEGSGYMMRAAFVVDKFMRALGLPGKAFVPLIVGFGCNVPAIMATRTLENHRERILTVLMAPFMSCGARLSVYALFAAAFFPVGGQNIVFALYLIGIAFAILTALAVKTTLLPGEASPFLMELPAYHVPKMKSMLLLTWSRLKGFLGDAGKIIVMMVVVINFLNSWGIDGSFGNEDSEKSVLSAISRSITPAFAPLGIEEENWPATVGIFTGILAKEVVVGTLDAIYSQIDLAADETAEAEEFVFMDAINTALETIPANLSDALQNLSDPLGLNVLENSGDQQLAAEEQGVDTATFGAMNARFDGQAGAFAYLLFILLYAPCTAATAAVYREAGARWTWFTLAWTTGLGYSAATAFYQLARFDQQPATATAWLIGISLSLGAALMVMRQAGKQQQREALT